MFHLIVKSLVHKSTACSSVSKCADDLNAVSNVTFKKDESMSPNVNHFTTAFDTDDVTTDTQCVISLMLQSSTDENIVTSSFESIQTLYLL